MVDHDAMRAAFRRAQLSDAYEFVIELANLDAITMYPDVRKRLLGLAYLLDAVSNELRS